MSSIPLWRFLPLAFCLLVPAASAIPLQWSSSNGGNDHWYERVDYTSWWHEADQMAADGGGYLVTFQSLEENVFVWSNLGAFGYWIGAYQINKDDEPSGNWAWVTGEDWSFENWRFGEPNDSLKLEDYVRLVANGEWNDVLNAPLPNDSPEQAEGRKGAGFIVEYDRYPVPAPTPLSLISLVVTVALWSWKSAAKRR